MIAISLSPFDASERFISNKESEARRFAPIFVSDIPCHIPHMPRLNLILIFIFSLAQLKPSDFHSKTAELAAGVQPIAGRGEKQIPDVR